MEVVYISHPLTAQSEIERLKNIESAERWAAWFAWTFKVATITEWAGLARYWTEQQGRALGLEIDKEHVRRSDRVFMLNQNGEGIVSSGMRVEGETGRSFDKQVIDLTRFKFEDRGMIENLWNRGELYLHRWVP